MPQKPVYDPLIQGFSGLATVQAGSDEARPRMLRTILPDKLTAITASQAITAALLARERTGEGQHVRLSMLEAVVAFLWASDMAGQTFVGDEPARAGSRELDRSDLRDRRRLHHRRGADRPAMGGADPRARTAGMARGRALQDAGAAAENVDARLQMTQDVLIGGKSAEWLDKLTKADVPCAPGADAQRDDPPSACRGARDRRANTTTRRPAGCAKRAPRRASRRPRPRSAAARRRSASIPTRCSAKSAIRPRRSPRCAPRGAAG